MSFLFSSGHHVWREALTKFLNWMELGVFAQFQLSLTSRKLMFADQGKNIWSPEELITQVTPRTKLNWGCTYEMYLSFAFSKLEYCWLFWQNTIIPNGLEKFLLGFIGSRRLVSNYWYLVIIFLTIPPASHRSLFKVPKVPWFFPTK